MMSLGRFGWKRRYSSTISWTSITGGRVWRRQGRTRVIVAIGTAVGLAEGSGTGACHASTSRYR